MNWRMALACDVPYGMMVVTICFLSTMKLMFSGGCLGLFFDLVLKRLRWGEPKGEVIVGTSKEGVRGRGQPTSMTVPHTNMFL